MQKLEELMQRLYHDRHEDNLDTVLPVIGDEGMGKSTLILQLAVAYYAEREGEAPSITHLLDRICYNRTGFQNMMANSEKQQLIIVPDAGRLLYSMDAAVAEQKEIEKSLMDVRGLEYMMILGFQSWDRIGGEIKDRRSKLTLKIPRRGLVRGYSREDMDEKLDTGCWPQSTLSDKFPPLDGTDLWEEYQRVDEEQKRNRLGVDGEDALSPEDAAKQADRATAIKAVKPWDSENGESYREAANKIAFNKDWVGETIRDWRDGHYRHLVDTPENETASLQADA